MTVRLGLLDTAVNHVGRPAPGALARVGAAGRDQEQEDRRERVSS